MVTKRVSRSAFAVALAGLLAAAGCSSGAASGGAGGNSKGDYVIGMTDDLSGKLAAYGKWAQQAWTAYFNGVNATGGINGRKVKLVILDDASTASRATANVRQLISQGALLVTGSTQSNMCSVVAPLATLKKVPLMCTATAEGTATGSTKYVFGRIMPGPTEAAPTLQLIQQIDKSGSPRVAVVHTDSADTVEFGKELQKVVTGKGWTTTSNTTLPSDATANVVGPTASIAGQHPTFVGTDMIAPLVVSMLHALRADGSNVPFSLAVPDYQSLTSLKDPNYYQLWGHALVDATSTEPAVQTLVKSMASVGVKGTAAINDGRLLDDYLAAAAIGEALKTCGAKCDRDGLADALANTQLNLPGITVGSWGFTPERHLPVSAFTAYKYDAKAGKVVVAQENLPAGS
jgi:branched-chain amino acid transport system substrate-binding protein